MPRVPLPGRARSVGRTPPLHCTPLHSTLPRARGWPPQTSAAAPLASLHPAGARRALGRPADRARRPAQPGGGEARPTPGAGAQDRGKDAPAAALAATRAPCSPSSSLRRSRGFSPPGRGSHAQPSPGSRAPSPSARRRPRAPSPRAQGSLACPAPAHSPELHIQDAEAEEHVEDPLA